MTKETVSLISKEIPSLQDQVTFDPETNTKTVISYEEDDDGKTYKETRVYKIQKIRVPVSVARRKAWKKYGEAANDPPGPNFANTFPAEIVNINYINRLPNAGEKASQEERAGAAAAAKTKQAITCRICKGSHFSLQCPFRGEFEALTTFMDSAGGNSADSQAPDAMTKAAAKELAPELNTGRYIPPSLRAAAAAAANSGTPVPDRRRSEDYSVRVSNLPEKTSEADLREIFGSFGNITRVFPAASRGFAFISFQREEEAATAIYAVNGMRYHHLILKADWAQPSAN